MKRRTFLGSALAFFIPTVSIANQVTETQSISTDEIDFYKFFEKFNGFTISEQQKSFYDWYKKDYKMMSMGRRVGATTFLITLAAWLELEKNISVLFISSDYKTSKMCCDKYYVNCYKLTHGKNLKGPMFTSSPSNSLKDYTNYKTYDFLIFDTHTDDYDLKMSHHSFCLNTYDCGCEPLGDTYNGFNKI